MRGGPVQYEMASCIRLSGERGVRGNDGWEPLDAMAGDVLLPPGGGGEGRCAIARMLHDQRLFGHQMHAG